MDGAASVFAAVSIAIQLAESVKKLSDFWKSVQEAPQDVQNIVTDLDLLTAALCEIALEAQRIEPDATLESALRSCEVSSATLVNILNDLQPGFASMRRTVRKWTAIRSIMKWDKIKKFQSTLDRLKSTLMLIRQNQISRIVHAQSQEQQKLLLSMNLQVSRLQLIQASEESFDRADSTSTNRFSPAVCQDKTPRTVLVTSECSKCAESDRVRSDDYSVPNHGPSREVKMNDGDENITVISSGPIDLRSTPFSQRSIWTKRLLYESRSSIDSFFGSLQIVSTTKSLRLSVKSTDMEEGDDDGPREIETLINIQPAPWLRNFGIIQGLSLRLIDSSISGWKHTLTSFRLVPDDAPVFRLCLDGNVPAVRKLFIDGAASVKDTLSDGTTPLHVAAERRHVTLCRFLIESGADTGAFRGEYFARSPFYSIFDGEDVDRGTDDIIDTCRLFTDCQDFSGTDLWHFLIPALRMGMSEAVIRWLLRQMAHDVNANFSQYKARYVFTGLARFCTKETVRLWLKSSPKGIVDTIHDYFGHAVLFDSIVRRPEISSVLLELGADPHRPSRLATNPTSLQMESPTSTAMHSSCAFAEWRSSLLDYGIDIEVFLKTEVDRNLGADCGWTLETLQKLFRWNFDPLGNWIEDHCNDCGYSIPAVQPLWCFSLGEIKGGTDPEDTIWEISDALESIRLDGEFDDSATSPVQQSGFPYSKDEFCCVGCWYKFMEIGERRQRFSSRKEENLDFEDEESASSDERFSPYYIHL